MTNDQLIILVPKGAEYNAVCQGVKTSSSVPLVFSIPIGVKALTQYLDNDFSLLPSKVLIMGLCGSLSPKFGVGDVVLYESCRYGESVAECDLGGSPDPVLPDRSFTTQLYQQLKPKVTVVKSLTSDSVVYSTSEKRRLAEKFSAEVVDMEGFAALKILSQRGISVAILRVVSDDSKHNIPNFNSAIDEQGNLQTLLLAREMISQPIAAFHLIKGSLKALKLLQEVASEVTNLM